ncbi:hypothetical protein [Pseudomonas piscis]
MKYLAGFLVCLPLLSATADELGTTTNYGVAGPGGTEIVNQTTSVPVYTTDGGTSINGFSSTTVTGGSSVNGSGAPIPDGTIGSQSNISYGVGVSIPLDSK